MTTGWLLKHPPPLPAPDVLQGKVLQAGRTKAFGVRPDFSRLAAPVVQCARRCIKGLATSEQMLDSHTARRPYRIICPPSSGVDGLQLVSLIQVLLAISRKLTRGLTAGLNEGRKQQVLMGVTGSGKTFTMANVIQHVQRPTLVLSHNKTLAAQLYSEFREFFPHNAVHYFVSYYDYYQPEAYIPQRDIYIEKDASINEEIDRLRLAATSALVSRQDVIIVASVSCIYGLGSPDDYRAMMIPLIRGGETDRDEMLAKLVDIQYGRNDVEFARGKFRVRGDCVEVWPAYEEFGIRIEFWGDEIEQLSIINPTSGEVVEHRESLFIYPAKHFVLPEERIEGAVCSIRDGAGRTTRSLQAGRQAARSAALVGPHALRYRNDFRSWLLPGHRELQPAS